jgi:hypothetical protein
MINGVDLSPKEGHALFEAAIVIVLMVYSVNDTT